MKRLILFGAILLGLGGSAGGCRVFEGAAGIHTDPVTGEKSSDGTGGIAGGLLGILIPGAPAVIAALAAAYANAKRKQWKNAALSTFEAVESFKETDQGKKVWSELKDRLGAAQAEVKIQEFVDEQLKKL